MKTSIRSNLGLGVMVLGLFVLACASGYNKPANDYYEEGLLFYDRMEYARSVESFTKVLELAPHGKDNHLVYFNRGMAYFKDRQYDKAVYDYTKALELAPPGDREFQFNCLEARANAYNNARRYDQAIGDYGEALFCRPGMNGRNTYLTTGPGPGSAKRITMPPCSISTRRSQLTPTLIWPISGGRRCGTKKRTINGRWLM